jgi:hypothetical protein
MRPVSAGVCPGFASEFVAELRQYLKANGFVTREGAPSLARLDGKMLTEELQRFFDFKMDQFTAKKEKAAAERKARAAFVPPSPAEVEAYSREIGWPMNGCDWCDAYAKKGWKVGTVGMRDWKAAVRTWKAQHILPSTAGTPLSTPAPAAAGLAEPEGWQAFIDKHLVDHCRYKTGNSPGAVPWAKVDSIFKKFLIEEMAKPQ